MTDEIQSAERRHRDGLRALHLGEHGLPIVPILAGLGNSEDVLGSKDIQPSRLSPSLVCDLGRLEAAEARDSVRKFFAECAVSAREEEAWAKEIADLSDRWPQFLRSGIAALSEELALSSGMLADINREGVIDRAARLREHAYRRRRSPGMETSSKLLAELMKSAGARGLSRGEAVDAIRELNAGPEDSARNSLPAGMEAESFLDELIRKGALQRSQGRNERLACPIPSFRDFLIREGESVRVLDCATAQNAAASAAACNLEHKARGGVASDLRFLAESDNFGISVEAVGRRASEIDIRFWASIAAKATRDSRSEKNDCKTP